MQILSVTHCCMDSQLHTQHYNCLLSDLTLQCALKTAQQRTIIQQYGTLAVDGWAVTFSTARRGLGGLRPHPDPFKPLKQM